MGKISLFREQNFGEPGGLECQRTEVRANGEGPKNHRKHKIKVLTTMEKIGGVGLQLKKGW